MSLLTGLGTFHCVNVNHYTSYNQLGCQTVLSHTRLKYISVFIARSLRYSQIQYPFILRNKKINL